MKPNIPTWLTLFRMIIMPIFILIFYLPFRHAPLLCSLIFVIAAVTDWFDGFLARRWKQITNFGAFLDPVADKIIVIIALVLINGYFHTWFITLPSIIIIIREIIILALREWMALIGKQNNIVVSWMSKLKTITQMLSISVLLWHPDELVILLGIIILYISTILTFYSMFQYFFKI